MSGSETWLLVDFKNVQNVKEWMNIAWDMGILLLVSIHENQHNKWWEEKN